MTGWASATTNEEVQTARHRHQTPTSPMPRNRWSVPRRPPRQTMKPNRKEAAQNERQKITVQESPVSMKRATVPPKLQHNAERKTRTNPSRSS